MVDGTAILNSREKGCVLPVVPFELPKTERERRLLRYRQSDSKIPMKIHTFLLSFVPILQLCTSYPLDTPHTRRASLQRALDLSTGAAAVGASLVVIALPTQASAVLSSKPCVAGIGDGCVDLATDNDLIRSLQMQSAAKREVYAKVCSLSLDGLLVGAMNNSDNPCYSQLPRTKLVCWLRDFSLNGAPGIQKCLLYEKLP